MTKSPHLKHMLLFAPTKPNKPKNYYKGLRLVDKYEAEEAKELPSKFAATHAPPPLPHHHPTPVSQDPLPARGAIAKGSFDCHCPWGGGGREVVRYMSLAPRLTRIKKSPGSTR